MYAINIMLRVFGILIPMGGEMMRGSGLNTAPLPAGEPKPNPAREMTPAAQSPSNGPTLFQRSNFRPLTFFFSLLNTSFYPPIYININLSFSYTTWQVRLTKWWYRKRRKSQQSTGGNLKSTILNLSLVVLIFNLGFNFKFYVIYLFLLINELKF